MSWLNVRGEIYICKECESKIQVEHGGGPQMTQVGDDNVYVQHELSKRLGQPLTNPEEEGYYFYLPGSCESCFNKSTVEHKRKYFRKCVVSEGKNFNPSIMYEGSVRFPVKGSPEITFYIKKRDWLG